jgi:phospholipid/cholesterol/gamma-HCH transport system substrate-binding protein
MGRTATWVGAFVMLGAVVTGGLASVFGGGQPRGNAYSAVFVDGSGLTPGSDVRAAGVTIGSVSAVEVQPDNKALVRFEVGNDVGLEQTTQATIKYKNLLGDRYLALSPGGGAGPVLAPGGTIPAAQTHPALSLNELFNGFAPLFQGLQPTEINQLSGSIVAILQGEGGSVDELLGQVGSLTGRLADRDKVIGDLLVNLNGVLATVDSHSDQLNGTVVHLRELVAGLSGDRERIGNSIDGINDLSSSVGELLHEARPDLKTAIEQLDRASKVLNDDSPEINSALQNLPAYYQVLGRIGGHAAAINFYLCGVQARLTVAGQTVLSPMIQSEVARCKF